MSRRQVDPAQVFAARNAPGRPRRKTRRERDAQGAFAKGFAAGREYGPAAKHWYTRPWLIRAWTVGCAEGIRIGR